MSDASPGSSAHDGLERNLRFITVHEMLTATAPWNVVLMLFNWARFDADGAIALSAVYYLAVVVFEVPSGWASDRFGRVKTLRVVGIAWMAAFAAWSLIDGSYLVAAGGYVLIAAGYACLSGTDVSLHYDTLEALDRAETYPDRQARLIARGRVVGTLGALAGGLLGLIDLRIPFMISFALAAAQLAVTFGMTEPPRSDRVTKGVVGQVRDCLQYLRDVPLRWIFGYGVAMVVLEHVAVNLLGPWIGEALDATPEDVGATPLVTGIVLAATGLIGAVSARFTVDVARRVGVRALLVALGMLSAIIVTVMAGVAHLAVLPLVALRQVQVAAAPILISAAVAPVVAQHHRATLLSLNSLGGRFLWGSVLLSAAGIAGDNVRLALGWYATASWTLVAVILVTAILVRRHHPPVTI